MPDPPATAFRPRRPATAFRPRRPATAFRPRRPARDTVAPHRAVLRRFARSRTGMAGLIVLAALVLAALAGPVLWRYGYQDLTPDLGAPPSWQHPMGTDRGGYDMLARVLRGVQRSVLVGFAVAFLSTALGVTIGATAGYCRGAVDAVLMRTTDLVLTVPAIAVLAVLTGAATLTRHWLVVAVILAAVSWERKARLVRATFLSLRDQEFVVAARAAGASSFRIVFCHLLPNAAAPIIVTATLSMASAITAEAALAYLGLGISPPDVSLGTLVQRGESAAPTLPWLFYLPGLTVVILVLSVNLVGDALRAALDPTSTRSDRGSVISP